jgi:hypothetical protein
MAYGVSPADFGVGAVATLGRLEIQGGVFNGEGYTKPDLDLGKEVAARVTGQVLKLDSAQAVSVSAYGSYGDLADRTTTRALGAVAWQGPGLTVQAEYLYALDDDKMTGSRVRGGGPAAFALVDLPWRLRAIGRFEWLRNATSPVIGKGYRLVAALGYRAHERLNLVAGYRQSNSDDMLMAQELLAGFDASF